MLIVMLGSCYGNVVCGNVVMFLKVHCLKVCYFHWRCFGLTTEGMDEDGINSLSFAETCVGHWYIVTDNLIWCSRKCWHLWVSIH